LLLLVILLSPRPGYAQHPAEGVFSFGAALGYQIGQTLSDARIVAESRGESLGCRSAEVTAFLNARFCKPESSTPSDIETLLLSALHDQPVLPAYTLHLDDSTVVAIAVEVASLAGLGRHQIEAHMDELGSRALEGHSDGPIPRQMIVWVDPAGRDYLMMECMMLPETGRCTLLIGHRQTTGEMEQSLERWRKLAPLPLAEEAREPSA